MKVLLPEPAFRSQVKQLARRPASLNGMVVGFLDGWGHKREDGTYDMYPLMAEIRSRLERRFELSDVKWQKKPHIGRAVPEPMLSEFLEGVDVVVNGECI